MKHLALLALGAALATGVVLAWTLLGDERGAGGADEPRAPVAEAHPGTQAAPAELAERAPLEPKVEAPAPEAPAEPARAFAVRGVARGIAGEPVAGLGLATAQDGADAAPRGETDAEGRFALELPRAIGRVVSADPGWVVVRGGEYRADPASAPPAQLTLLVAPRTAWFGTVVDGATGAPVAGAEVQLVAPCGSDALGKENAAPTDADGRFAIDPAPSLAGLRLALRAERYREHALELLPGAADLGVLALEHAEEPPRVSGRLLANAQPVPLAEVVLGAARTRSNQEGFFELSVADPAPGAMLWATAPGQSGGLAGVGERLLAGDSVLDLVIDLAPRESGIAGRVLDAERNPLRGFEVTALSQASPIPAAKLGGRTRKDGAFAIEGLAPGEYTLVARGRQSAEVAVQAGVLAPAQGVELVMSADRRALAGSVLGPAGTPAANHRVELLFSSAPGSASIASTLSDASGAFTFAAAPSHAVTLRALPEPGESLFPATLEVPAGASGPLALTLHPGRPVCFEAQDLSAPPTALFALDAAGRALPHFRASGTEALWSELQAGRSEPLLFSEEAVQLVLVRAGREIARCPISAAPGGLLRW
jgi:hypothetical protein